MPKQTAAVAKPKRDREHAVALRLTPDEFAEFKACAASDERALSSFIRLAALRGMAEYKRDPRALFEFKSN